MLASEVLIPFGGSAPPTPASTSMLASEVLIPFGGSVSVATPSQAAGCSTVNSDSVERFAGHPLKSVSTTNVIAPGGIDAVSDVSVVVDPASSSGPPPTLKRTT